MNALRELLSISLLSIYFYCNRCVEREGATRGHVWQRSVLTDGSVLCEEASVHVHSLADALGALRRQVATLVYTGAYTSAYTGAESAESTTAPLDLYSSLIPQVSLTPPPAHLHSHLLIRSLLNSTLTSRYLIGFIYAPIVTR